MRWEDKSSLAAKGCRYRLHDDYDHARQGIRLLSGAQDGLTILF